MYNYKGDEVAMINVVVQIINIIKRALEYIDTFLFYNSKSHSYKQRDRFKIKKLY